MTAIGESRPQTAAYFARQIAAKDATSRELHEWNIEFRL